MKLIYKTLSSKTLQLNIIFIKLLYKKKKSVTLIRAEVINVTL